MKIGVVRILDTNPVIPPEVFDLVRIFVLYRLIRPSSSSSSTAFCPASSSEMSSLAFFFLPLRDFLRFAFDFSSSLWLSCSVSSTFSFYAAASRLESFLSRLFRTSSSASSCSTFSTSEPLLLSRSRCLRLSFLRLRRLPLGLLSSSDDIFGNVALFGTSCI